MFVSASSGRVFTAAMASASSATPSVAMKAASVGAKTVYWSFAVERRHQAGSNHRRLQDIKFPIRLQNNLDDGGLARLGRRCGQVRVSG